VITFLVTIQQEASGKLHIRCETPPGSASVDEINCGMEFKRKFKEWQRAVTNRDWKHLSGPPKNQ
jgi:hypothetical protein